MLGRQSRYTVVAGHCGALMSRRYAIYCWHSGNHSYYHNDGSNKRGLIDRMTNYSTHISNTPQSEPLDSRQVQNSAGGYTYQLDKWGRLHRFLVLGNEGGTYYATERKLTLDNCKSILECANENPGRAVSIIIDMSVSGRVAKNDTCIFALALIAKKCGMTSGRQLAHKAVSAVCRTGTHLFQFAECISNLGGWGRGSRRAVADWYTGKDKYDELEYQLVKYQQRNGWSHRDLLRLSHPVPEDDKQAALFAWVTQHAETEHLSDVGLIHGMVLIKDATPEKAADIIVKYGLPRECVPSELLNSRVVWEALLSQGMPLTAMIRNLGVMTKNGVLQPFSTNESIVTATLANEHAIHKSRLHPITVLSALRTYQSGYGVKGSLTWTPNQSVVTGLEKAFYLSFKIIQPTGKRFMLALDVSGSMDTGEIAGVPGLTPRQAVAAMAMTTLKTEQNCIVAAFSHSLIPCPIGPNMSLNEVSYVMSRISFGRTDCSLPMLHALQYKVPVDVFVVYTDNETWSGSVHPMKALRDYRQKMGIAAKLVVVGMTATGFTIADPDDAGCMDVVGFDSSAPGIISDFAA